MAINSEVPKQIPLSDLEDSPAFSASEEWTIPSLTDIDPRMVSFLLDVDLDEMFVFFTSRDIPYEIEDLENGNGLLLRSDSDQVVGVVIRRYLGNAIHNHPDLVGAVRLATIVSGKTIAEPQSNQASPQGHSAILALATNFGDWLKTRLTQRDRDEALIAATSIFGIS